MDGVMRNWLTNMRAAFASDLYPADFIAFRSYFVVSTFLLMANRQADFLALLKICLAEY
jgi:hypothetical protein